MHRDPVQRQGDMLAQKGAVSRQLLDFTIQIDVPVRHFAPPLGGKNKHRADAAINVDPAILTRCTGQRVQGIEFLFAAINIHRQ